MHEKLSRNYPANYDAYARTVPADAYWNQVRRTVDGRPVSEAQIALIVNAIEAQLSLMASDLVLDLACGNGALSSYLFDKCHGLVGVDISPYLVEVAEKVFARPPKYCFVQDDVVSYLQHQKDTTAFTKALIYSGLQYFPKSDVVLIFKSLFRRFLNIHSVFIGNVPNKRQAHRFFRDRPAAEAEVNDHEARIGLWYLPEELEALANSCGWRASVSYMPAEFYLSSYRFDVTLERPDP
ncbi:MAG TPA: class I SAM-dependent methyltransferase [Xanthobacteraceae bacterium]|nr:class I SAM-dependent methyltransferase [Xanthobacteraceae bacterium]